MGQSQKSMDPTKTDLTYDIQNPFDPRETDTTLYIMAALSGASPLMEKVERMPQKTERNYNSWFESFKEWLILFIQNTQNGLPPIGDLARKVELIEVLEASLKPAEIQDIKPSLDRLKENFQKIKEGRDALQTQGRDYTDNFQHSGGEALKMISLQPDMGRSQPMVRIHKEQSESQRLLRLSLTQQRDKIEKLKADATLLSTQLTNRMPPEKAKDIVEKEAEKTRSLEFGAAGG